MNEGERLAEIRRRLAANEYYLNPHSDANTREDIADLVELVEQRDQRVAKLEKKTKLLSAQVLELTQEIENVRSDFGGQR